MKAIKLDAKFRPIQVTIETDIEYKTLLACLNTPASITRKNGGSNSITDKQHSDTVYSMYCTLVDTNGQL